MQQEIKTGIITKMLLIVNILLYTLTYFLKDIINLNDILGLHQITSDKFHVYQFITYMFMHGNVDHLIFNLFCIAMMGKFVEHTLRTEKFIYYYIISGVGAAILHLLVKHLTNSMLLTDKSIINNEVLIGSSGAVFGLIYAFGRFYAELKLKLYFMFEISAKSFAISTAIVELLLGIVNYKDNIAHFAHLGGLLVGYLTIKYWRYRNFKKMRGE